MIKNILAILFFASISLASYAQTQNDGAKSAHLKAHQLQLANAKSYKMDASVVGALQKDGIALSSEIDPNLSVESIELITDILDEANKHMGKPYKHGKKGPDSFDCSGFTSYVYKQFGFNISPASRMQYNDGVSVERNQLRKGDLVFFTSRSSGSNVGHVGMVVNADNETGEFEFIHASIKGVKISSCEGYYANRYVGARRIITN